MMNSSSAFLMLCLAFGLLALESRAQEAGGWEADVAFQYFSPDEDSLFEDDFGFELEARKMITDIIGVGLSVGWAEWENAEGTQSAAFNPFVFPGVSLTAAVDGDTTLIPIGVSLYIRPTAPEGPIHVNLGVGFRYVVVDPDISATLIVSGPGGEVSQTSDYETDDGILFAFQGDLAYDLSEMAYLFVGIGYQVDLDEPETKVSHPEIFTAPIAFDTPLEAFFGRVGIGYRF